MAKGLPELQALLKSAEALGFNYHTTQQKHGKTRWLYAAAGSDETRISDIYFIQFVATKVRQGGPSDFAVAPRPAHQAEPVKPRRIGVALRFNLYEALHKKQKGELDSSFSLQQIARDSVHSLKKTEQHKTASLDEAKSVSKMHPQRQAIMAGIFACIAERINSERSALYNNCFKALDGSIELKRSKQSNSDAKKLLTCYSALQTFLTENAVPKGNKEMREQAKEIQIWLVKRTQKLKRALEKSTPEVAAPKR